MMLGAATEHSSSKASATLWVFQGDDVVAFDPSDFSRGTAVKVPPAARIYPERFAINGRGQMLLPSNDGSLWFWNGAKATTVTAPADDPINPRAPESQVERRWLLGNDGSSLFVLETFPGGGPPGASQVRIMQTGLDRRTRELVLSYEHLPCQHTVEPAGTFESPAPDVWAPNGVVRDFLVVTHWEHQWSDYVPEPDSNITHPDDLPSCSALQTVCWHHESGGWSNDDIDNPPLLDAAAQGSVRLQLDETVEMNGYENGCGRVKFTTPASQIVLSNTCANYPAPNYDAGIMPANAILAPGGRRAAITLRGSPASDAKISLRYEAHADSLELRALRRALAEMPVVDIYEPGVASKPRLRIGHVELVGWTSNREVLVVQRGHIVGIDVETGRRRESTIEVQSAESARVVWP